MGASPYFAELRLCTTDRLAAVEGVNNLNGHYPLLEGLEAGVGTPIEQMQRYISRGVPGDVDLL